MRESKKSGRFAVCNPKTFNDNERIQVSLVYSYKVSLVSRDNSKLAIYFYTEDKVSNSDIKQKMLEQLYYITFINDGAIKFYNIDNSKAYILKTSKETLDEVKRLLLNNKWVATAELLDYLFPRDKNIFKNRNENYSISEQKDKQCKK
ncbi:hypothetical protein [Campylobacter sp. RM16188]|uniref:hypothetical protein n=1 Tax=Campylobacter sp. RM16188 TaxID=1705725 RepID=UPI001553578E|nr:hypothetical protein [Campylobacter sp. RM16188]